MFGCVASGINNPDFSLRLRLEKSPDVELAAKEALRGIGGPRPLWAASASAPICLRRNDGCSLRRPADCYFPPLPPLSLSGQ